MPKPLRRDWELAADGEFYEDFTWRAPFSVFREVQQLIEDLTDRSHVINWKAILVDLQRFLPLLEVSHEPFTREDHLGAIDGVLVQRDDLPWTVTVRIYVERAKKQALIDDMMTLRERLIRCAASTGAKAP
jgi:hypothetical protein